MRQSRTDAPAAVGGGYSQNLNSMCGECGVEREGRGLQRRSLNGDDVSDGAGEWGAEQSGDDVRG